MTGTPRRAAAALLLAALLAALPAACARRYAVSVNDRTLRGPAAGPAAMADAGLQGCVNLAARRRGVAAAELAVLSCPGAGIQDLGNIGRLRRLRFLDLSGNGIGDLAPLGGLPRLGGLNLAGNRITDIGPLLGIGTLRSVGLEGNDGVPCAQLAALRERLGDGLTPPERCGG